MIIQVDQIFCAFLWKYKIILNRVHRLVNIAFKWFALFSEETPIYGGNQMDDAMKYTRMDDTGASHVWTSSLKPNTFML